MTTGYGQAYFDNPEIWSSETWRGRSGDIERARLASEWLPGEVNSVLDVGCGNGVFTNMVEPNRFKVGLDLSKVALVNVTAPQLRADAIRLPFADNTFDATLCMEMLEHLSALAYQSALNELRRVARKYILITVPFDEKLVYNRVICPACLCAFHPYHHVRQYQLTSFETLFGPESRLVRLDSIVPTRREALPGLWNYIRRYQHRGGRNYPSGVICPQCGYTPAKNSVSVKQVPRTHRLGSTLSRLWPKRKTFTWWMAFYQKGA